MGNGNGELRTARSIQDLLDEFRATGQQAPFEEIVRRCAGMVYHVCLQITRNSHDAEDATQAVFLTLAVQAKTGKPIRALGPWLQQVAYRMSLDMRKSKKRRLLREERRAQCAERFAPDGLAQASMQELRQLLMDELNKLPSKYRLPLILHYFGGLSREEMASQLNCKTTTLGVRLHRGREMLSNRLNGRGVALAGGLLTLAIATAVKGAISDAVLANTCEAATALAAGRTIGPGIVSVQVLSVLRHAATAVLLARAKLAASVLLLAGTAVAGAAQVLHKVRSIEPKISVPEAIDRFLKQPLQAPVRPIFSSNVQPSQNAAGAKEIAADVWQLAKMGGSDRTNLTWNPGLVSSPGFYLMPKGSGFVAVWQRPSQQITARGVDSLVVLSKGPVFGPVMHPQFAPEATRPIWPAPGASYARNGTGRASPANDTHFATVASQAGPLRSAVPSLSKPPLRRSNGGTMEPPNWPFDPVALASAGATSGFTNPLPTMDYRPLPNMAMGDSGTRMVTIPVLDGASADASTSFAGIDASTYLPPVASTFGSTASFALPAGWPHATAFDVAWVPDDYASSSASGGSSPMVSAVSLQVTPEPGTLMLTVGAALLLLGRKRNRRAD